MKCDKCDKKTEEVHTKSEYNDLTITDVQRANQKKHLENKWLCSSCWNKTVIKYDLPVYEIHNEQEK